MLDSLRGTDAADGTIDRIKRHRASGGATVLLAAVALVGCGNTDRDPGVQPAPASTDRMSVAPDDPSVSTRPPSPGELVTQTIQDEAGPATVPEQ